MFLGCGILVKARLRNVILTYLIHFIFILQGVPKVHSSNFIHYNF